MPDLAPVDLMARLLPATPDGYYGFSGLARTKPRCSITSRSTSTSRQWKDENLNGPNSAWVRLPRFIVEGMATTPEFVPISENVSEYESFVRDRIRGAYTSDPTQGMHFWQFHRYSPLPRR